MTYVKDMAGLVFGDLTVLEYSHSKMKDGAYWVCQCACGATAVVLGCRLRQGVTRSCGCFARRLSAERGRQFKKEPMACSIDGCGKQQSAGGYCGMHAQRVRRYGDPNYVTSNEQFREKCREAALRGKEAKPGTYKKLFNRHEHRVVAEQKLGRQLLHGEIVHHLDGNKHNNVPSNLEVMTQADHLRLHHAEMWVARKAKYGY